MSLPDKRSPAPTLASADRAKRHWNADTLTTNAIQSEDYAALVIARRLHVPVHVARVVVTLASLGGRLA